MRSGTIKTLVALVASMTLGAALLLAMETAPARPTVPLPLQATSGSMPEMTAVRTVDPQIGIQYVKWRNVVIHDTTRDGLAVAEGCHFVVGSAGRIGEGVVKPTKLWYQQADGRHIDVPGGDYDAHSIGICVLTDGRSGPTEKQMVALANLIRTLQAACQIPPERVYLHSDLAQDGCPGRHFPAESLRRTLLPAQ